MPAGQQEDDPRPRLRLGILASHAGTTMQAIIDACAEGRLHAEVRVVIGNNSRSGALARARAYGIPTAHLSSVTHPNEADLDRAITETLDGHRVDIVALAGYMKRLGPAVLSRYKGRMLNTHPALLPKFGGQGMYGDRVHEAVLAAGEEITGASVHLVEGDYDTGPVLSQIEVPVLATDTLETLRDRVQEAERQHYVEVLERIAMGEIVLEGLRR
ncbi:MAG: phosphoribosylglycinamide formyltransferase [Chloroflexota bacterium]|nr:phosphoribosylglycinamide formyltransferase [Chloroflexota bacterium]